MKVSKLTWAAGFMVVVMLLSIAPVNKYLAASPGMQASPSAACELGPWTLKSTGPAARVRHGAVTDGQYLYIYGGEIANPPMGDSGSEINSPDSIHANPAPDAFTADAWRYAPQTDTWVPIANMPNAKTNIKGTYDNGKIYVPGGWLSGAIATDEMAIYTISTNTWTTGTPMPAPTFGAASAAYNGKIYVAGGTNGSAFLSTLVIYNIASNTWSSGANLPGISAYGGMVTVGDYLYYAAGFDGVSILNTLYRYDPNSNSWITLAPLNSARISPEVMSDGKHIYAVNGGNASLWNGLPIPETVEIYDVFTNSWTYGTPVVNSLTGSGGARIGNQLVIMGGYNTTVLFSNSVQASTIGQACFPDCSRDLEWIDRGVGPSARYRSASAAAGQYLYVFGGQNGAKQTDLHSLVDASQVDGLASPDAQLGDAWRYNPNTNIWQPLAAMPTAKSNTQAAYWNGKIYVPGGYTGSFLDELAIYNIALNSWSTGAPLLTPRSTGAAAAYNGKIYVAGGNPGPTNELVIYNIASNSWSYGAPLPVNITYGRMITVGKYIYYAGGIENGATTTNTLYRYDPALNFWTTLAPMQTARTSAELMSNGTYIFAVNGGGASYFTGVPLAQTVEIYQIDTNTWMYGAPTLFTSAAPAGGRVGNHMIIYGGVDGVTYYDRVNIANFCTKGFLPCVLK